MTISGTYPILSTTPTILSLPLTSMDDPCLVTTRELRLLDLLVLLVEYTLSVFTNDARSKSRRLVYPKI